MKRLIITILVLSFCGCAFGQGKDCFPAKGEKPFQAGEKVTFSLMYKWGAVNSEVGTAVLTLSEEALEGETVYHSNFWARSSSVFDLFFKMREDFNSWFSISDLQPRKFTRDTFEGGYTADNLYLYDWDADAIHADICFNGQPRQLMDIPLAGCVQDLPSLTYNLRTLNLDAMNPGERKPLRFAIDDMVYDIYLTYMGKDVRKIRRVGNIPCHHLGCSVVTGAMFEGDADVEIWLSADKNHVPVAVMAPLRWGAVWALIKTYDNPKYEFDTGRKK